MGGTETEFLLLKRLPDYQRLHNLSWWMSGRTYGYQNLVSIFPGIENCLKAGYLPYADGKQPSIPLINLGRNERGNDDDES